MQELSGGAPGPDGQPMRRIEGKLGSQASQAAPNMTTQGILHESQAKQARKVASSMSKPQRDHSEAEVTDGHAPLGLNEMEQSAIAALMIMHTSRSRSATPYVDDDTSVATPLVREPMASKYTPFATTGMVPLSCTS